MLISFLISAQEPKVDEIFKLHVVQKNSAQFHLVWEIKDHYFLYQEKISLSKASPSILEFAPLRFPPAETKSAPSGHMDYIYHHALRLSIDLLAKDPGEAISVLHYQGCSDEGICYPPQTINLKFSMDDELNLKQVNLEKTELNLIAEDSFIQPEDSPIQMDKFGEILSKKSPWIIILAFLGFGLLLSFTPCILPMIPILSSIILGQGATRSSGKSFFLSFSYVLGMSFTYALIGAFFALMGSNLQILMQAPITIAFLSLLFFILALSMFDVLNFKIPTSWNERIGSMPQIKTGGSLLNALIMGALSSLILSPCVTAPLIGALTYISQTGNVLLGSMALFCIGFGMGFPLLLIGSSLGKFLPKAGLWMEKIKIIFGFILIIIAMQLLERIIPGFAILDLWIAIWVITGFFLHQTESKIGKLPVKYLAYFFYLLALILSLNAYLGASRSQPTETESNLIHQSAQVVSSVEAADQALRSKPGKIALLDFYADWCTTCKNIESSMLKDPELLALLKKIDFIIVDLSANTKDRQDLLSHFDVIAPPTFLFYNQGRKENKADRLVGEIDASALKKHLKLFLGEN